jgi:outer membrane receptor protein involved in Fe transport
MRKSIWLMSAGLFAISAPAFAQSTTDTDKAAAQPTEGATAEAGAVADTAQATTPVDSGDIIVTATRRNEALSDVPLAVSAVTAETLENSGINDIRQLTQVSPSLLVSSTSSEAAAGGARIRGIGTVGDNPGLESSVAVFVDGVYRSRVGVGLTELGQVDRIEVLRGPQGTLFGRNASAGLISIITAKPRFQTAVNGQIDVGNYNMRRVEAGITGAISSQLAGRIDGVFLKRDGFLRDVVSGRDVNNRDRFLIRAQALFQPSDDLSVRVIGDLSKRNEECCAASFLTATQYTAAGGRQPSTLKLLLNSIGAQIQDDTFARRVSITPGRSYRSDVTDDGVSAEIVKDFGGAELTSISAYRFNKFIRGQDADFQALDVLYRPDDGTAFNRFRTFTQEVRLQGTAFNERLDWLVGGYGANEKLDLADNLSTGKDADLFFGTLIRANPALATFPGYNLLNPFAAGFVQAQLANSPLTAAQRTAIANAVAGNVVNTPLANQGTRDLFRQNSNNLAVFTHNIIKIVPDQVSLTLGARYTREKKTLRADLNTTSVCAAFQQNLARLAAFAAAPPATLGPLAPTAAALATALRTQVLTPLAAAPCVINPINGSFSGGKKSENRVSGTAVISFKPTPDVLTYASYSRGYKAGGFNLDRAGLTFGNVNLNALQFAPEINNAFELGAKYNGRGFDLNVAAFRQSFQNFQLNTFNGVNFVVENINGCKNSLNGADTDASNAAVACTGGRRSGVRSQGVEVEAFARPMRDLSINAGATYVQTKYQRNLIGAAGNAIIPALFQLPGRNLSNAPVFTGTASISYRPEIGTGGLKALFYVDGRHSSSFNTGSDLDIEKVQDSYNVVNGRVGISGPNNLWSVELFAQNITNENYLQVAFDAPLQGSSTQRAVDAGFAASSNQLFGGFLAEPRTYGLTLRTKF